MRIVVTGGTGFIGREIVSRLAASGDDEIVVTSREPGRSRPPAEGVRSVQAFAGDPISLGRAFTGADVVVHSMQFPNHPVEQPRRGRSYMKVDGEGTRVAARVAKALGVRRFVYLSGAGAGEGRPEPWFRAKDLAEQAIRESGMEYAILRPSWIYGPSDRSLNRFVFFCRHLPVVPVIGDGRTPVQPIHVGDVARAAVEAARREDATAKVLELGGPEKLTMDEIVRAVQKVIGRRRPLLHHPVPLMKLLALPMLLLPEPFLSPGAVGFITQEALVDPGPTAEYLGFAFRRLEDGLREYLA